MQTSALRKLTKVLCVKGKGSMKDSFQRVINNESGENTWFRQARSIYINMLKHEAKEGT